MANQTGIEWCDATWNPVVGCTAVSPGCEKCYAARQAATRLAHLEAYQGLAVIDTTHRTRWTGKVRMLEHRVREPLKWLKPKKIFVNSMSDLFHKDVPDEFLDRVFAVMALTPQHTYQVLTKRTERMREYMGDPATPHRVARGESAYRIAQDYPVSDTQVRNIITGAQWSAELPFEWPLPSVWAGTSVEDQQRANERIPHLQNTPAAVRFLSCEPLLERLNLTDLEGIDWVIVGGETGPGARRMNPDWAREIRDNCKAAGVPFFMKQMSGREPIPDDLMIREWPRGEVKDEEKWSLKNDVR